MKWVICHDGRRVNLNHVRSYYKRRSSAYIDPTDWVVDLDHNDSGTEWSYVCEGVSEAVADQVVQRIDWFIMTDENVAGGNIFDVRNILDRLTPSVTGGTTEAVDGTTTMPAETPVSG